MMTKWEKESLKSLGMRTPSFYYSFTEISLYGMIEVVEECKKKKVEITFFLF